MLVKKIPKDWMTNSENKLHELGCDCLNHGYHSSTRGCYGGSNFGPAGPKGE